MWISRVDDADKIVKLLPAVVSLLEHISFNRNAQVHENTKLKTGLSAVEIMSRTKFAMAVIFPSFFPLSLSDMS